MKGNQKVNYSHSTIEISLISAVRDGRLEEVRELINSFGLSYSQAWSEGYALLCDAIEHKHAAVVKLLLARDSKVNSENKTTFDTPLHFAATVGDIEIVEMLLDKNAKIDAKTISGRTPLYNAIENKNMQVTELLLRHGADVNARDNEGYTPLHVASEEGDEKTTKFLLNKGADISARTKDNLTPLYVATNSRRETVVKLLLQYGAKVDDHNKDGKTILHLAVEKGRFLMVKDVLKYCPDINNQSNRSSLKTAVYGYGFEYKIIIEDLLEYGLIVNPSDANNPKLLNAAVERGHLQIVEDLLKYGTDVNTITLLHWAVACRREEVAKLLISYGANINAQDETEKTPILYAIENCDVEIFELLLNNGANVKENPEPLHIAIKNEHLKIVKTLLQHAADINATDEYGRTALHINALGEEFLGLTDSAIDIKEEITKLLLNKGADINAEQKDGMTALQVATQNGHENVVKVLLESGAKIDSKIKNDILFLGARKGCQAIIDTVLTFGVDIDSKDEQGRTALHIASHHRRAKVVASLLEYGANINITCRNNLTPLECVTDFMYTTPSATALENHIVKMKTANLFVSEKNLLSMISSEAIRAFQCECEEEIARMKSEKINNASISFYDILVKSTSSVAIYMRNKNIVQVLKSDLSKFPLYAGMIKSHFRKGMERKELLEQGNEIFHFLFNNFSELPHVCIEKIFSYLNDEDLRVLRDACKSPSISSPNININDEAVTSNISQVQSTSKP